MTLLLLFLSQLVVISPTMTTNDCEILDADVLVLGGGMAGVAAANRLQTFGIKFLLFEAGPSLGGRMKKTEVFPGVFTSEGPVYIQGVDPRKPELHPIYKLMQDCGGLQGFFTRDKIVYNGSSDVTALFKRRQGVYYQAWEDAANIAKARQSQNMPDISVGEALSQSGWIPQTPLDKITEWISFDFCASVDPYQFSLYSLVQATTYTDFVSSESIADGEEEGTDYLITDSRGYVHLAKCLASNFSDNQVHLNSRVTKIMNNNNCVCIEVAKNNGNKKYCGRYAILTFSIGVIKSESFRSVLSPYFSKAKQEAFEIFSMGHYLKIYLNYNETFWDMNVTFFARVDQVKGNFPLFTNAFMSSDINALIIVLTEDLANQALARNLTALIDNITEALREIYGNTVPPPKHIYRESYYTNPLFLGSYVSINAGVKNNTYKIIQSPERSLYLAGGGIHEKYPGYVHGAYLSGISTAEMVNTAILNSSSIHISETGYIIFLLGFLIFDILLY